MKILYYVAFICLYLGSSQAGTMDPKVPDSKYIEYGQKHECVLRIAGMYDDKMNTNFKGSCVLIDKDHILTAAHIVYGSMTQYVIFENKVYPCSLVAIHAKYNPKVMYQHDIAIAKLQRPIDIDFYPELYKDKDEVDKICSLAGFGFPGKFSSGYKVEKYDNKKRAGSNIIDGVDKNTLTFSVHKEPQTSLEFLITPGDSGGGLFINKKLAGIHSCVYATDGKTDGDYGDVGCSTRISDYVEWVDKTKQIIQEILEKPNAIQEKP